MGRKRIEVKRFHPRDIAAAIASERSDLDPSGYLYLVYLTRLGRILDLIWEDYCRKACAISSADMRVLLALRRAGRPYMLRPTELFRSLLITSGAITKQVDRLSKAGFLKRKRETKGGGLFIQLTDR